MENNTNKDSGQATSTPRKELNAPRENNASIPEGTNDKKGGVSTAVKALAVLGIVALLLLGLFFTSRLIAGLPETARSIAAGFVSVTSQFFGTDEEGTPTDVDDEDEDDNGIIVTDDEDEEDEGEEDPDEDSVVTTPEPTTGTTGGETVTRTRNEYRIVQRPVTRTGTTISDPNGTVDLELTILATGILDRTRNREFVERDEVDTADTVAVKFQVKNIGTKTSDDWWYRAELPTDTAFTYDSEEQLELKPGERMEFILAFTDIEDDRGTAEVEIEIDPARELDESTRSNNRETVGIRVDD